MGDTKTAPKRWCLSEHETLNSFEVWRQHQIWCLSQEKTFAPFLTDGITWSKKSTTNPTRGFTNDGGDNGVTAAQKVLHLESLLQQICNFCPIVSRSTIVKQSTSIASVWNMIRLHFGFHQTGAQFLNFDDIKLKPDERPETLYQRLLSFVEDCLLTKNSVIKHHDDTIEVDEEVTPTLENMIVLRWLQLINPDLPKIVKEKYSTDLRTRTLASLKPEISMALDSLLSSVQFENDAKLMRSTLYQGGSGKKFTNSSASNPLKNEKKCALCKAEGRQYFHFISKCNFLPPADKKYMSKLRSLALDEEENESDTDVIETPSVRKIDVRRVSIVQSPVLIASYNNIKLPIVIDSGATGNFIHLDVVRRLGISINKTRHKANQADGNAKMDVIGEIAVVFQKDHHQLYFDGLVVTKLDADVIGGSPFQDKNDIFPRVSKKCVQIGECQYPYDNEAVDRISNRRIQAHVVGLKSTTTVWPKEELQIPLPAHLQLEDEVAVEPRPDGCKSPLSPSLWPTPGIFSVSNGMLSIENKTDIPIVVNKNNHFCQVRAVDTYNCENTPFSDSYSDISPVKVSQISTKHSSLYSAEVQVDPDNQMDTKFRQMFHNQLKEFDTVFDPKFPGYNGSFGPIFSRVNMGPVQPPQRKGRLPLYNREKLVELQAKYDLLESLGVFKKPEDVDVPVEYLNPSFLVKKARGDGHRLVTAFADIGRYSKPQPVLMPDINSVLRTIGNWKHIITTDLTKAYFQVPLDRGSIKYCGVATPFKGVRVYVRASMGMPGSEVALEELMCRILGDLIESGVVCKLADNLFVGGQNLNELFTNWGHVLTALTKADLKLSAGQTVINPKATSLLGWKWRQGTISASSHQVNTLSVCNRPDTVKQLRTYIGAYKFLSRVLPECAIYLAPLDDIQAGKQSSDRLLWSDDQESAFRLSQTALSNNKTITLPKSSDQLWLVCDGALRKPGISSTLYIQEDEKFLVAGYFSAKLKKQQIGWLPCEVEALTISASLKYFSIYIIQSIHKTCILTDSIPCCQAFEKLCRGEFSCSPKVSTFLSTVSQYQASVRHIAGVNNVLSDFGSRNPIECNDERCKICSFVAESEECVVRNINIDEVISGNSKLPFTSRSAWVAIQSECPDLRRVCSHLRQGTRPSRKLTNIKDIKRYLNSVTISRDGLLVVRSKDPCSLKERIVVPRNVLSGVLTAIHIKLDCPKRHQMKLVCDRYFFALDLDKSIANVCQSCHKCASLQQFPKTIVPQSTSDPAEVVGSLFAADILKRERQDILVVREYVTSYTLTSILENEQASTLREGLILLCSELCPLDGPNSVIRVDPAPGFQSLENDKLLQNCRLSIEIGRRKNVNKNPVADRAIQELEEELLKLDPMGKAVSRMALARATLHLNSKIRSRGISSREMLFQRDQFSHKQIPISDESLIIEQHENRLKNHKYSEKSKNPNLTQPIYSDAKVGDLVYVHSDLSKAKSRDRYIVASEDGNWLNIRKFVGSQLRKNVYRVKRNEVFKVPHTSDIPHTKLNYPDSDDEIDISPNIVETPSEIHSLPSANHGSRESPPEVPSIPELYLSNSSQSTGQTIPMQNNNTPPCSNTDDVEMSNRTYPQRDRKSTSFLQIPCHNTKSYDT